MQITDFEWGPAVHQEANRCWAYAIIASICLSIYQLLQYRSSIPSTEDTQASISENKDERPREKEPVQNATTNTYSKIFVQLAIDCCDLIIPAVGLGWVSLDVVFVGVAGSISSMLAGQEIWNRVQSAASED